NPDIIEELKLDRRTLPRDTYQAAGYESRQVIDFNISIEVTEYRAQVWVNSTGKRYVAAFPAHVKRPVQYGPTVKAHAVYLSQYQWIPYQRIADYFASQVGLPLSTGSLFNFNHEAYELLEKFEFLSKEQLIDSHCIHADETGININGKRLWLHTTCNDQWTYFHPHHKRGKEAMDAMGILPYFKGIVCHDHWKPYYTYTCLHSLCNAHHIRELTWSAEEDEQDWANRMINFLKKLNKQVERSGGKLTKKQSQYYRKRYRKILSEGETSCPPAKKIVGKRGRPKKTKSRNLLERLIDYEDDVLRFMDNVEVSFTNNLGENDLRMTKVQQKISGCFRSEVGAKIFCRIRGYLITCRKHGVSPDEALASLFKRKLPNFTNNL
ncbi:MAG: IS66 family transposase, partial [Hyphomicrobiaceae bacterium]|nr:IS66 family transposase [Hyphomicrobiaceae bacterium]